MTKTIAHVGRSGYKGSSTRRPYAILRELRGGGGGKLLPFLREAGSRRGVSQSRRERWRPERPSRRRGILRA
ncbi:MAG TPA: hypothetical protein VEU62_00975, partial [Bryobacterales bacterium]|nr:hypothetical protein [Bryobacterales bacterium]